MKFIIRLLARVLFDRQSAAKSQETLHHVVMVRWDAKLGDSIVSSFFFREIRKLEGVIITVLTVDKLAGIYKRDFGVDRVIVTSVHPGVLELLKIWRQLGHVDVVVHLVGRIQPREIFFLWLLRARLVFSLDDTLRLVNRKLGNATCGWLFADKYAWVLSHLGVEAIKQEYIVPFAPSTVKRFSIAGTTDIVFNPFASRNDKALSHAKSLEVLHCIAEAFPSYTIGILSSSSTLLKAKQLEVDLGQANVVAIKGIETPHDAGSVVHQAQVVVSVDTAIVHMAVGLKKKLVAIYPFMEDQHNPWLPPASITTRVIYSRHDTYRYRLTGLKDMNNFATYEVVEAVRDLLRITEPRPAVTTIKAQLISGLGVASRTIARQLPLISQNFPEVTGCWPGTINLELETPMIVTDPDHRTAPLAWTPSGVTTEMFDLVRVKLEFSHLACPVPAWLYVAHRSPHRQTPTIHEVISHRLDITGATGCHVHIRSDSVMLGKTESNYCGLNSSMIDNVRSGCRSEQSNIVGQVQRTGTA